MNERTTAYRTCPLCEATCGLEITLDGESVVRIRGDRDDVFSHGFICPKGSTLKQLEADPDRLRQPLIKRNGRHEPASWDEAFALIDEQLRTIMGAQGSDAVGVYLGNPNVHSMSGPLYNRVLLKALQSKNIFSASTVDQMPKHVSAGFMFGHPDLIPVPDLDRTSYLLMLGANPFESNGSLATAPDWPGRMEAISERGGKVVVVDPRRTKTAAVADEHVFIRPGTDALLLFAMVHTLFEEHLVAPGELGEQLRGLDQVGAAAEAFTPERVASACGVEAATIRRLARELAAADTGVVYGRIGTHTAEFGTLAAWLVDVLNALTGNLDRPGGAMFSRAAHEQPRSKRGWSTGRWTSRAEGLPEVRGELPVSTLAAEIETPGEGQVRALITIAGNPVLSTPDGDRLDAALTSLEFMVSVDLYLNETTRHADVILPGSSPLRRPHYDFAFTQLSIRNVANYSPAVLPVPAESLEEWEVLLRLATIVSGMGVAADLDALDDMVLGRLIAQAVGNPDSPLMGRDPADITTMTDGERGPDRLLDFLVRSGPYGDAYGADPDGLTLARLQAAPHGIDFGPLQPRIPDGLATPSGKIELAPEAIMADVARLDRAADRTPNGHMVLIGRRHLRSNNSWMHNIDVLVKGKPRCTLQIHPSDATKLGVTDAAKVTSTSGSVIADVEITDTIMPGVVSLPHGWGHDMDGAQLSVASTRPGVNSNKLTPGAIDPLSGNAILNGIPVEVTPA
ncbi:MAG TPA: molybdopterin-dependent oxidoreductase [Acidimicrobiia bacterium]|jgi:anaerobic selenocysteine-containing dehydrogenase|nr:molybdopterin-dependent oxidoreductase [Acidimicrobiia bacterium]